jgi:SprT protein
MTNLAARFELVRAAAQNCLKKAEEIYGHKMPEMQVGFNLKGRVAGYAMRKYGVYSVRFNHVILAGNQWEAFIKEVVPHEVAHIVCYAYPELGRNHDYGWRSVCVKLGGSGARCH